ncbi:hypothetical protein MTO96_032184, partial [Rhipicephalus appendiculatus]
LCRGSLLFGRENTKRRRRRHGEGHDAVGHLPSTNTRGLLMEQQANKPSTGGEEHPCPCCERVFPTAERLAVHVKVHRGGPKRPLKCKECCRTFPRIDKLRAHELVHLVGKPYKCEICGKAFTHKDAQDLMWFGRPDLQESYVLCTIVRPTVERALLSHLLQGVMNF